MLLTLRTASDQPSPSSEICSNGGWGGGKEGVQGRLQPGWPVSAITRTTFSHRHSGSPCPRMAWQAATKVMGCPLSMAMGESWMRSWLSGIDGTESLNLGLSWAIQDVGSRYPQNFPDPEQSLLAEGHFSSVPALQIFDTRGPSLSLKK